MARWWASPLVVQWCVQADDLVSLNALVGKVCSPSEVLHHLFVGSGVPLLVLCLAPPLEMVYLLPEGLWMGVLVVMA